MKKNAKKKKPEKAKTGAWIITNEILFYYEDPFYPEKLEVRDSANAWWAKKDGQAKIDKAAQAFKTGLNLEEMYYFACLTQKMFSYFLQIHPHFCAYFEACKQNPRIAVKATIFNNLQDPNMARWYAEKKMGNEFQTKVVLDDPLAKINPAETKKILALGLEDLDDDEE